MNGTEAKVISSWVNGSRDISRESLCDALIPISQEVSVLMPPDSMAEAMDLVCHTDGMTICQRILDLAQSGLDKRPNRRGRLSEERIERIVADQLGVPFSILNKGESTTTMIRSARHIENVVVFDKLADYAAD